MLNKWKVSSIAGPNKRQCYQQNESYFIKEQNFSRKKDSGDRYVNMRFESGFTQAVYVCAIINKYSHKKQLAEIRNNIKLNKPVKVKVDEELGIIIPEDDLQ